ncbi:hypothetical protein MTO96_032728, partial [Rhipicephalus appendiculatus]
VSGSGDQEYRQPSVATLRSMAVLVAWRPRRTKVSAPVLRITRPSCCRMSRTSLPRGSVRWPPQAGWWALDVPAKPELPPQAMS